MTATGNASGSTNYTYTPLGQTQSEQETDGTGTQLSAENYTYDANGNQTQAALTVGAAGGPQTTTGYTYDALGQVTAMTDGARSFSYDPNGNVEKMIVDTPGQQLADEMDFGWDGLNRDTTVTDYVGPNRTPYQTFQYQYDQAGNVTSVETNNNTVTYSYDSANELTSVTQGSGSTGTQTMAYAYDANHNRTAMTCYVCGNPSGLTTSYSYANGTTNELTSLTDYSGHTTSFTYDANGNLLSRTYDPGQSDQAITSYTYTSTGLLASVTLPDGTTVAYTYDSNGQRTSTVVTPGAGASETASNITDTYQQGLLATETDATTGTLLATFTYDAHGVPVSVLVGSDPTTAPRYYYVFDGHGNVVALTDASGNPVATYSYDEFGNIETDTEDFASGWHNPYRFDGAERVRYDSTTGLDWMSVRAYDPMLGRFLARDPLERVPGEGLATQPYVYAKSNPLTYTDPSGYEEEEDDESRWGPVGGDGSDQGGSPGTPPTEPAGGANTTSASATGTEQIVTQVGDQVEITNYGPNGEMIDSYTFNVDPETLGDANDMANEGAFNEARVEQTASQANTPPSEPPNEPSGNDGNETTANETPTTSVGCGESFAPTTSVATPQGSQAIDTLQVGDAVTAVDPTTGKTSTQTVQHVFIDHDSDLLDVTLQVSASTAVGSSATAASDPDGKQRAINQASHGSHAPPSASASTSTATSAGASTATDASASSSASHDEVVHTTASHPWLTADRGFVRAGHLRVGERVRTADGRTAEVVALAVVPGSANMWDLTVSHVHTFAVGSGAYVVHNDSCDPTSTLRPGPNAGESIPARGPARDFTDTERDQIDAIGTATGCHTCGSTDPGTVSGHFIPDHQPPSALNENGEPQNLYPHCLACSRIQGGQVNRFLSLVRQGLLDFWPRTP